MNNHFKFKEEVILYGRRNSTGNPTKYHIINDKTEAAFCGFDSFTAEISISEESFYYWESDFCKKCLKKSNKSC